MYKLIATDLDCTLLRTDKSVSDEVKSVIEKAMNMGTYVVLATGRSYSAAKKFLDMFNSNTAILLNGGQIMVDGKVIYDAVLDKKTADEVSKAINQNGGTYIFWSEGKLYTNKINDLSLNYEKFQSTKMVETKPLPSKINKFIWLQADDYSKEVINGIEGVDSFHSSRDFLEIVPKGVNKGTGLKKLLELLNVDIKETIACGDDENDISMIEVAGLGAAPINAKDIVKEKSDFIFSSNDSDGIIEVFDRYIFNK